MPSPILKFTQGKFESMKTGNKINASSKYPVYAYKRDYKGNKGAWKFIPTAAQKKRGIKGYRCSIVKARGIKSTTKLDSGRASDKGAPASARYRHTSDYLRRGDGSIDSVGYPKGKKQPAPKVTKTTRVRGQKKAGGKAKPVNVMVEKAKTLKKKAVKQKESAEKAKTPKVRKEKAKKAESTAKKAQTAAKKVVESPKATKAQKDAARGTKRAAKKTEKSAKKVAEKAEKATKEKGKPKSKKASKKKKSKGAASRAGV